MNLDLRWKPVIFAVIAFGLSGLLAAGHVAADEESFELLPHWKKGEKLSFEMVKSRQKTQNEKITVDVTFRTDLELEVLNVDEDSFILALTWGELKIDDPKLAGNLILQKMSNLLKGYRIVLELDSEASIQGVQNWKEVKEAMTKQSETIINEFKPDKDDPTRAKFRDALASMVATKEQVEQLCTREAQLFFVVLGVEFEAGKPVEYEDTVSNMFGGEPFPSQGRFDLRDVDKQRGLARVTWTQTVKPEDAKRIIEKTIKDVRQRQGKTPAPSESEVMIVLIQDTGEFSVDTSSGWVQSFTHTHVVKTGAGSQEDTVSVTRKKD